MICRERIVMCGILLLFSMPAIAGEPVRKTNGKPAKRTLRVAVISPRCMFGDVAANLDHFAHLTERAAAKGARLVCFPELALVSYSTDPAVLKSAEKIPGPSTKKLEAIARRYKVYISVGMAERDKDRYYIAQILVGPNGYLGKYRKATPTGAERKCGFSPGKAFPTWEIDGFRFGILICADGRVPSTIRAMKKAKVDVIHHPHGNLVGHLGREAEEWTRSKTVYFVPRAVFARAHIIINNSAEDTKQPRKTNRYSSGAVVIDPLGQVVGRTDVADRKEKMILATLRKPEDLIPPFELQQLRRADSVFNERFKAK